MRGFRISALRALFGLVILTGCLAPVALGDLPYKFKYTFDVEIDGGDMIGPSKLTFGAADDADDELDKSTEGRYDVVYTGSPPMFPPMPVARVVFNTPWTVDEVLRHVDTSTDMRKTTTGEIIWKLELEETGFSTGRTVTLTRNEDSAYTDLKEFFENDRTLWFEGNGVNVDLLETHGTVEVELTKPGIYIIYAGSEEGGNATPVAIADEFTFLKTKTSTTVDLDVLANDIDADGDARTITGVCTPGDVDFDDTADTKLGGSVTINGNGTLIEYTLPLDDPAEDSDEDSFEYQIKDPSSAASSTTCTVNLQEILSTRKLCVQGTTTEIVAPIIVGDSLTVRLELQYYRADLAELRIEEILPMTGDTVPNYWRYTGNFDEKVDTVPVDTGVTPTQGSATKLTINYLDSPPGPVNGITVLQISYDVRSFPITEGSKTFHGQAYYNAEDFDMIPAKSLRTQMPQEPYVVGQAYETYSVVAIPYTGTGIANASDLIASIPDCTTVWQWIGTWDGYAKGSPFNDFAISAGAAYLVAVTDAGAFIVNGTGNADPTFTLSAGNNLIMLSTTKAGGITTASELIASISALANTTCTTVSRWDGEDQTWDGYASGSPFNDFPVSAGEAFLVFVETDGTPEW